MLHNKFPGKRIVMAEFGWPSAGYNRHDAKPGRIEQAVVLRDFVARAESLGIDYNIIEALDQPWKVDRRHRRLALGIPRCVARSRNSRGPERSRCTNHWTLVGIALLIGLLMSLPILRLRPPDA